MDIDHKIRLIVIIVSVFYGIIGMILYSFILPDTIGVFFAIILMVAAVMLFVRSLFGGGKTKYADSEVEADLDEFMFIYYVISIPLFAIYYFFPEYSYFLYLGIFFVFIATFYIVVFLINWIKNR